MLKFGMTHIDIFRDIKWPARLRDYFPINSFNLSAVGVPVPNAEVAPFL